MPVAMPTIVSRSRESHSPFERKQHRCAYQSDFRNGTWITRPIGVICATQGFKRLNQNVRLSKMAGK